MSSCALTSRKTKPLTALFEVVNRIYGITAKERTDVDVWHPEVRFFELYDENHELRGSFYLDLYAREHKPRRSVDGRLRRADAQA
ncbi:Oligopeptidase A [Raoultella planticola]|uniref:Oligopeptidase A n=1 Tax=Raoultella planticola TaxID=575 RepID=A0A485BAQ9_RAOPL|nr:Oligopeptidase A [Raoultella planticola]